MYGGGLSSVVLTIVLISLMAAVTADIKKDCRRESNVSWGALKKLKAGNFEQDDPKLKCYFRCFLTKAGILNKNTEVDVQRALRHLPRSMQDSSKKLLNKCKSVSGKDPCDKAFEIVKCSVKSRPEILKSVSLV